MNTLKMSEKRNRHIMDGESPDPRWKDLYRIGGVACLLFGVLTLLAIVIYFIWPYKPGYSSVAEIFTTLHNDRLGGLMSLDFLMVIIMIIAIPIWLALYVALKHVNESYALLALILGLVACIVILTVRPIAEMLYLSDKYAAATTQAARSQYLAAGEALSALFTGTAWIIYMILFGVSQLIYSLLMLHSNSFSKTTAYLGIILCIGMGVFLPVIGTLLSVLTTFISPIWYFLIARTFFRLGWSTAPALPEAS